MIGPRRNLRRGVHLLGFNQTSSISGKPACRSGQRISSPSAQELAARSPAAAARPAPPEEAAPAVLPAGVRYGPPEEVAQGRRVRPGEAVRFASQQAAAADLPPAEWAAAWSAG
jgi:hypothetical protein